MKSVKTREEEYCKIFASEKDAQAADWVTTYNVVVGEIEKKNRERGTWQAAERRAGKVAALN